MQDTAKASQPGGPSIEGPADIYIYIYIYIYKWHVCLSSYKSVNKKGEGGMGERREEGEEVDEGGRRGEERGGEEGEEVGGRRDEGGGRGGGSIV